MDLNNAVHFEILDESIITSEYSDTVPEYYRNAIEYPFRYIDIIYYYSIINILIKYLSHGDAQYQALISFNSDRRILRFDHSNLQNAVSHKLVLEKGKYVYNYFGNKDRTIKMGLNHPRLTALIREKFDF
jgi:hypothetical protein